MISIKKITAIFLIFPLFWGTAGAFSVSARSAILYDPLSGKALFEKNADEQRPMASTTKIMTAVCALSQCSLSEEVTVKREYTLVEGSSMYLKAGEKLSVECLLHGLLLLSGNDAAEAIAGYVSGSNDAFAAIMNQKAKELSLMNTHFENPSGLDGKTHYTTARDLARLAAYAMALPEFQEIASKKQYSEGTRSMRNHNRLLWSYEGADGVKTGYTKKSGRCLVSSAERSGRRLVAVTLNAPDDWDDHMAMLNYGFSVFTDTTLCTAQEPVLSVPVISGISGKVAVFCPDEASFYLSEEEKSQIKYEFYGPHFVYAPVRAGERYGTMRVTLNENTLYETPVYFKDFVPIRTHTDKSIGLLKKIANFFGF